MIRVCEAAHFDEAQDVIIVGDDVDLAAGATMVARDDAVALAYQMANGELFSGSAAGGARCQGSEPRLALGLGVRFGGRLLCRDIRFNDRCCCQL